MPKLILGEEGDKLGRVSQLLGSNQNAVLLTSDLHSPVDLSHLVLPLTSSDIFLSLGERFSS